MSYSQARFLCLRTGGCARPGGLGHLERWRCPRTASPDSLLLLLLLGRRVLEDKQSLVVHIPKDQAHDVINNKTDNLSFKVRARRT